MGTGYAYGDANHLDAVTSTPSYSASYDTAGSMTARNGQALSYDMLRRLTHWQNTASSPTSTADYAYNGSGERVQQKTVTTSNGVTTTITTTYIGAFEEVATSVQTGSCSPCATSTATTKYYQAGPVTALKRKDACRFLVGWEGERHQRPKGQAMPPSQLTLDATTVQRLFTAHEPLAKLWNRS